MDNYLFSLFGVLAAIMISRLILDKANKALPSEKKTELVDLFSGSKKWRFLILFIIIVSFTLSIRYKLMDLPTLQYTYFSIICVYVLISNFFNYRKLARADFPKNYVQMFILSQVITIVAIILMLVAALTV